MSKADKIFKQNLREIIDKNISSVGHNVRPRWEDGTPAHTIMNFGVANTYDLREEFPAITVRQTGLKSCMDEILWIYQKKSNNINDLKPHIWDEWADEDGSIGNAYGYQVGQKYVHHKIDISKLTLNEFKNITCALQKEYPSAEIDLSNGNVSFDQMDAVLYDLKNDPFSRRIMISLWNTTDLHKMNLQPCCWSLTFSVTDEGLDKLVLNLVLNQRSNDMIAANNWNTAQYSILLMMVAQVSNMIPGKLLHVITNQHIYDRHIDVAKTLLDREEYPAPIVKLNPNVKNFYDFTTNDLNVENYRYGEQVKFEIAI